MSHGILCGFPMKHEHIRKKVNTALKHDLTYGRVKIEPFILPKEEKTVQNSNSNSKKRSSKNKAA